MQLQEEFNKSRPRDGIKVNAVCPGTSHSKMRLPRTETISVADSADVIGTDIIFNVSETKTTYSVAGYLATMHMPGLGDCTTPYEDVPRGKVLWHDLSVVKEDNETENVVEKASN